MLHACFTAWDGAARCRAGFFGAIEPKKRIPRNNVLLVGAVALIGAMVLSFERGVELLNFGALLAFMGVNTAALARFYFREARKRWFNLVSPVLGFLDLHAVVAEPELARQSVGNCMDGDRLSVRRLQHTWIQTGTREFRNSRW